MKFEHITYEVKEGTALITINRPEVYNALARQSKTEIIGAIKAANKDPEVGTIVLTGEGKAFCSGQDLGDRQAQEVDLGYTLETEWNPLIKAMRDSKKIVITAINGVVAGAGLSVALSADMTIAKPNTKFVCGFSKLSLGPDAGSSFTFTNALGPKIALEFFLTDRPLISEQLAEKGLINHIDADPVDFALDIAKKLNILPPSTISMTKKNIQLAMETTYADSVQFETASQSYLGSTNNFKEGIQAFFEKRQPNFNKNI